MVNVSEYGLTEYLCLYPNAAAQPECKEDATLHEDPRRYGSLIWFPDLDQHEGDQESEGYRQEYNNTRLAPLQNVSHVHGTNEEIFGAHSISRPTPLQYQTQTHDTRKQS